MGLIADALRSMPSQQGADPDTIPDALAKGWDSGIDTSKAALHQVAGLIAENFDADQFARARYADAQQLREQAQLNGPQLHSYKDIKGLRDALTWGAGVTGGMAPVAGTAIGLGLLTRNPMLAGTAVMAPIEMGDIAARQQMDPATASQPASTRLRDAAIGGVASAALQNVGPAMLANRLMKPVGQGVAAGIGQSVARDASINAATAFGGEGIKQFSANQDAPFNTDQLAEATVTGGVLGGAFGAAGGMVDAVRGAPMPDVSGVRQSINERLAARKAAAEAARTPVQIDPPEPSAYERAGAFMERGKTAIDDTVDRVSRNMPLGDLQEMASASGQRLKDMVDLSDNQTAQKVKEWGEEMLGKLSPDDARVDQIKNFMANASDRVAQAGMANLKKAWDAGQRVSKKVDDLWHDLKKTGDNARKSFEEGYAEGRGQPMDLNTIDGEVTDVSNRIGNSPKLLKSEDTSGARAAVLKALQDSGIAQRRPDLFESQGTVQKMAHTLLAMSTEAAKGPLSSTTLAKAIDVFGPDTVHVLETVAQKLGSASDPQATEALFGNINRAREMAKQTEELNDFLRQALTEESQDTMLSRDVPDLAEFLVRHAKGDFKGAGPEQTKAMNARVAEMLKQHFGENADAVSKRIEKEARARMGEESIRDAETGYDENGQPISQTEPDRIIIGRGKSNAMMVDPDIFKAQKRQGLNHAQQALLDAKAKYPDRHVYFQRQEGSKEWGHIVAEKLTDKADFNDADLASMRLDTKAHSKSEARIEVGGMILDGVKITKVMRSRGHGDFEGETRWTNKQQIVDAFKRGIAQLANQFGEVPKVHDNAVIGFDGGKKVTWGEAKKLDVRTMADREQDALVQRATDLRDEYKVAKDKGASEQRLAEIKSEYKEVVGKIEGKKNAELSADPDALKDDAVDESKPQKPNREGQIHQAAADIKDKDLEINYNQDNTKRFMTGTTSGTEALQNKASELRARTSAAQRAVGDKLMALTEPKVYNKLTEGEQDVLSRALLPKTKPSEIAAIVSPLIEKYRVKVSELKKAAPGKDKSLPPEADPALKEASLAAMLDKVKNEGHYGEKLKTIDELEKRLAELQQKQADYEKSSGYADRANSKVEDSWKPNDTIIKDPEIAAIQKELATREGSPDPKVVAAKKAALLEKAASGDKDLIEELSTSTDAKGLQRAVGAMVSRLEQMSSAMASVDPSKFPKVQEIMQRLRDEAAAGNYKSALRIPGMKEAVRELAQGRRDNVPGSGDVRNTLRASIGSLGNLTRNSALTRTLIDLASRGERLGEMMRAIRDDESVPSQFRAVAHAIQEVAGYVPTVFEGNDARFEAFYNSETHTVHINDKPGEMLPWVALHEGVHAATVKALAADSKLYKAAYDLLDHVVQHDPSLNGAYGATNVLEFVAEALSNKWLQEKLAKIPANDKVAEYLGTRAADAWHQFIDFIKDALGIKSEDTNALTQILELSGHAMRTTEQHGWAVDNVPDRVLNHGLLDMHHAVDAYDTIIRKTGNKDLQSTRDAYADLIKDPSKALTHSEALALKIISKNDDLLNAVKGLSAAEFKDLVNNVKMFVGQSNLGAAIDATNKRLSELIQNPDVAYGMATKKYDLSGTNPTINHATGSRPDIGQYIQRTLGNSVRLAWANLTHAGEYIHGNTQGLIRLSVHALDPMSTAFHESLHAFVGQLRDAGAHDVISVLERTAQSRHVLEQLMHIYRNEPEVLKQLRDPEERIAYMYQQWALDPQGFKVSIAARGVFGKIAAFIRNMLGMWSNDERALHIMEYFHSGEYARTRQNSANVGAAVRRQVMDIHRSRIFETAKSFTEPLAKLSDAMIGMGSTRVRETEVPALIELADLIKRDHTDASGRADPGFIPAARLEATKMRTRLANELEGFTREQLQDAQEALQKAVPASTPESQRAADLIKTFLADTRQYMVDAGVKIGHLGPDYYPRVWDTHYISKNQQAFRDMLEPYIRSGAMKGTADDLIRNLINRDGNEFGIETRMPGMQFAKERVLDFISPTDAAPFMQKDMMGTLNSYLTQAARRAEWNRRLGDGRLERLWTRAQAEGATPDQLSMAEDYLKGVDGTLGDGLNPTARRLMGNMIVYQNVRLLPLAAFSMLIDPNGVMIRGGTVGDAWSTFKRGMKELGSAWSEKGPTPDEAAQLAELVGTIESATLSHTMGDLYTQGMVGGTAQQINNAFFKYNFVEGLNRSFRIGATEAAMKFMARHADLTNSPHSKRWMDELGVQQGDIVLRPDGRIALTEAEGLTKAQEQRVHSAINQWVDGAILRPDAADKPIWMNDPHFALISHLKQFVFSFQKTILERTLHELKHGNYAPAMALASYVPIMIAADLIKNTLINGGQTPSWQEGWEVSDYVGYGIERAGLFGVGQFGVDVAQDIQRGNTGFFALSGPTIEQLRDGIELIGGHKQFSTTAIDSMPANALYKHTLGAPTSADAVVTN